MQYLAIAFPPPSLNPTAKCPAWHLSDRAKDWVGRDKYQNVDATPVWSSEDAVSEFSDKLIGKLDTVVGEDAVTKLFLVPDSTFSLTLTLNLTLRVSFLPYIYKKSMIS